ncbi:uncharacterized protein DSM5745_00230 [Aspergillus mulundensis]|uniref:Uncharacterized protein n=1 Tax=Aspergillus mulundensis TaxID=1810919 RepID=A0A3D8T4I3_9EURO|nr:hypothetical protein DSM5745_00230 [Aspergillus mulundensis]RDW92908.1 hypothetical protein DSM5745_00230 [Aspergillus mulundensis]
MGDPKGRYKLVQVDPHTEEISDDELRTIVECEKESFTGDLKRSAFQFFYFVNDENDPADVQRATDNLMKIHRQWIASNEELRFLKVLDTHEDDKLVGGMWFSVYKVAPVDKNPWERIEARWWDSRPKDTAWWGTTETQRDYLTKAIRILSSPWREYFRWRKHIHVRMVFLSAEARHADPYDNNYPGTLLIEELRRLGEEDRDLSLFAEVWIDRDLRSVFEWWANSAVGNPFGGVPICPKFEYHGDGLYHPEIWDELPWGDESKWSKEWRAMHEKFHVVDGHVRPVGCFFAYGPPLRYYNEWTVLNEREKVAPWERMINRPEEVIEQGDWLSCPFPEDE